MSQLPAAHRQTHTQEEGQSVSGPAPCRPAQTERRASQSASSAAHRQTHTQEEGQSVSELRHPDVQTVEPFKLSEV